MNLNSVDLETYAVELRNAINQMPEYSLTNEFDIIKLITDPVVTDPINRNPQIVTLGWYYEWGACGNGVRG